MKLNSLSIIISLVLTTGCEDESVLSDGTNQTTGSGGSTSNNTGGTWAIPVSEVRDGGPGKDGIPALLDPDFTEPERAGYLSEDDLVIAFKMGDVIKVFPHDILDWHEIVNDKIGDFKFAINYCPLTGTGMAWNRTIGDTETTFGVSGLLYNSNLIPYDRATNSNWSQMRLDCVNGNLYGTQAELLPIIETTLETLKRMYPEIQVLSSNTGYSRSYGYYPYGDYKTDHNYLLFPVKNKDDRIENKERVHGIIANGGSIVFRFESFTNLTELYEFVMTGEQFVVVGNKQDNFIVSFMNSNDTGEILSFTALQNEYPLIMKDQLGNKYDVFGVVQEGPHKGNQLRPARSFIGYWFAWAAFYPNVQIFYE